MQIPSSNRLPIRLLRFLVAIAICQTAPAATLLVLNNNDSGAGSLRQGIISNAALGGGNTIVFSNTVTGVITLGSELLISNSVTITGPGDKFLALSGNNATRIFHLTNSVTAAISGLTIANGVNGARGGGIWQETGSLTLTGCTLSSNSASGNGGAIEADASLTASNCAFVANTCEVSGGGIYLLSGPMILDGCLFLSNSVGFGGGGGIYFSAPSGSVQTCTFNGNHAPGGGLQNAGTLSVANCTFYGNTGGNGGGILNTGLITVRNTIVAGNTGGSKPDCSGTFLSGGFNFIGASDGSSGFGAGGDQLGSIASPLNPLLGPLQNNGGPTLTMALLSGSPAIDQGNSGSLTNDQRGAPRPFDLSAIANAAGGNGGDIGAFELGSPPLSIQHVTTNIVVSWPAYYGGFTLQYVTPLASVNTWSNAPGSPVVVGSQFNVTNGPAAANAFFRLMLP